MCARSSMREKPVRPPRSGRPQSGRRVWAPRYPERVTPPSVERTRQAVCEAEDTLAAARAAISEIESRSRGVGQAIPWAERDVEREAKTVL